MNDIEKLENVFSTDIDELIYCLFDKSEAP